MKYTYVIFDLDGTLTDTYKGVANSIKYALNKLEIPLDESANLGRFLGPPLVWSFENVLGLSPEMSQKAVEAYREYYSDIGIYENTLYDGMEDLLKNIYQSGGKILLATSKPEVFALRVLEKLDILQYFYACKGSDLKDKDPQKKDIISSVLKQALSLDGVECSEHVLEKCIMIGDRKFDIQGAKECSMESVGALWGYGNLEEFNEYGATFTAQNVAELGAILG